jgi:hypothetical protein
MSLEPLQAKGTAWQKSGARQANGRVQRNIAESLAGVAAYRGDGANANDDDEGKHDGVLDGSRAVFRLQESLYSFVPDAH